MYNYSTNWVVANDALVGEYELDLIVKENSSGTIIYSKQITFDVRLFSSIGSWNSSIRTAYVMVDDQIVWNSDEHTPSGDGLLPDQFVDLTQYSFSGLVG